MKIFDAHCDVLMKMLLEPNINFIDGPHLHVTKSGLAKAGVSVQMFAIYVPEAIHPSMRFEAALTMVELFFEKIIKEAGLKFIRDKDDLKSLNKGEIGAILALEGCDCIEQDLLRLRTLLRLGVSSVGLTWNHANALADGALEERQGGLTRLGKEAVTLLNGAGCWCDVSHLSEAGFWYCLKLHNKVIASHSNCHSIVPHPRNLTDEQIKALIHHDGQIGITFVPDFLTKGTSAVIADVIHHLDHICSLGGKGHVGFGSDFDGIDGTVIGLDKVEAYQNLVNELLKYYREEDVCGFLYENFASRF